MAVGVVTGTDNIAPIADPVGGRPLLEGHAEDDTYIREGKKSSLFFSISLQSRYPSSTTLDPNACRPTPVLMRSLEVASNSSSNEGEGPCILGMDSGLICGRCGGSGGSHVGRCVNNVPG